MAVKIRLARGGAKKKPYYRVVVANATAPRDGDFIEKVGTYNPLLAKGAGDRITLKADRIAYWLSQGAAPTEKVAKFIADSGIELPGFVKSKIALKDKVRSVQAQKRAEEKAAKLATEKAEQEAAAAEEAAKAAEAAKATEAAQAAAAAEAQEASEAVQADESSDKAAE
jgi:small subunit ribosomal protein S16